MSEENKNSDLVGSTLKDILAAKEKFASDPWLRKHTQEKLNKQGIPITIDEFGMGHLYTPLYVTKIRSHQ